MKREIKFRAWDDDRNSMSPVNSLTSWIKDAYAQFPQENGDGFFEKIIWMQFTGLTDKNGKEIYEGDLIGYWHDAYWAVGWSEEKGKYMFQYPGCEHDIIPSTGESLKGKDGFAVTKSVCSKKEVIGNIYQNKELLS